MDSRRLCRFMKRALQVNKRLLYLPKRTSEDVFVETNIHTFAAIRENERMSLQAEILIVAPSHDK